MKCAIWCAPCTPSRYIKYLNPASWILWLDFDTALSEINTTYVFFAAKNCNFLHNFNMKTSLKLNNGSEMPMVSFPHVKLECMHYFSVISLIINY